MAYPFDPRNAHHIPKQRYRVMNWPSYEAGLRNRGSLTVWISDDAIAGWEAEKRSDRGGQPTYSNLAILTALSIRSVFRQTFRQAEGFLSSIVGLLGIDLAIPDHTTMSRRSRTVDVPLPKPRRDGQPVELQIDSTGLKFHGPGEWTVEKHGTKTRKSWRKLHLAIDADTGDIVAVDLTEKEEDDAGMVGPLLDHIAAPVSSVTADGAYDTDGATAAIAARHPQAKIIIPPRKTAVLSDAAETEPTQRDRHIKEIAKHGRRGWAKRSRYNLRARAENAMRRYKQVLGEVLRAKLLATQKTEVKIAAFVLNQMGKLGRPASVRIA
jgi:Transposase DDE domain